MVAMHKNRSVDAHDFSMIPRASVPRASFRRQSSHKTTFDSGYLVPFFVDEVLPGDTFRLSTTMFARLGPTALINPIMDNIWLDTFFFFVPNRLVWTHWVNFMGEQANPADSISFSIPQMVCPAGGYAIGSLQDYFGLPTVGQVTGGLTVTASNLPLRAYELIYNTWFRDENLINSNTVDTGDGPDNPLNYTMRRRGKRHDYFTSCLPWPQKGGLNVVVPLAGNAPVKGLGLHTSNTTAPVAGTGNVWEGDGTFRTYTWELHVGLAAPSDFVADMSSNSAATAFPKVYADLSQATGTTINQLRQSFQIQKLLERDARGGTRYTEIIRSHFGVISPDARLQRPEYLGGGTTPINVSPVPQTSGSGATGTTTALGSLSASGAGTHSSGFSQSFTEHGHVIGLCSVRADLSYQQGLRKLWSRLTRYDFYFPVFAMLGEQAVLNKEIYVTGTTVQDNAVFGYQERWAEYRYFPSMITGQFRSTYATPLDSWHLSQKFTALPALNTAFIEETPPLSRILASAITGAQIIMDAFFDIVSARPLPLYSVPGLIDHF